MKDKLQAACRLLRSPLVLLGAAAAAVFLWAYWATLGGLAEKWSNSPQYAHGFLVPAFAAFILWVRRGQLKTELVRPCAWGLALLAATEALRVAGAYFYFPWFDAVSLLPALAGLFLLLGGWHVLRWAWPAVGFLFFMLPLPYLVESAMAHPLQNLATQVSTYLLQTMGFPAFAEGNIIVLTEARVGVAEACNGLGMLVIFFAVSTTVAFIVREPLWEKLVLVASAVPIALFANVLRITATAAGSQMIGAERAHAVFHDGGGWLMMPLALLLLWLELRLIGRLLVKPAPKENPVNAVKAILPGAAPGTGRGGRRFRRRLKASASPVSKH
jgi:exosortase